MSHWIMGIFAAVLGLVGLFMAGAAHDFGILAFGLAPVTVRRPVLLVDDQDRLRRGRRGIGRRLARVDPSALLEGPASPRADRKRLT